MRKGQQHWAIGDVFLIKLKDEKFVLGQIVGREADVLNSVSCAFFDFRVSDPKDIESILELPKDRVFSVLFVTRDLLDSGQWEIMGNRPISVTKELLPYEGLREKGYVGAKVTGSRNVNEFVNAFYGLHPWDDWKDPEYLDKLLVSKDKKPKSLVFKKNG